MVNRIALLDLLLKKIYGSLTGKLIELLMRPPRRLYLRVNTLKTTRENVLAELSREDIVAHPDDFIPDAVYLEIEGPFTLECPGNKIVVVDAKAAASLLLGANLYRPGLLRAEPFSANEYVLAISKENIPVACIKTIQSYDEVLAKRSGIVGINICSPYRAPKIAETRAYKQGLVYVQSAPSIITTYLLHPRGGELVVDMNASPGGKTGHIVQLSHGKARVIAIDRSEKKVRELHNTLERLGLSLNVVSIPADSRYVHLDFNIRGKADKVLIDPPCSNLGVRPLLGFKKTLKDIISLSNYQKQFLKAAWHILKPGGILVYSTCTLTAVENEENVVHAVGEIGFNIVELEEVPPYAEKVSYKGVIAYRFSPLSWDMPGYFIAIFAK